MKHLKTLEINEDRIDEMGGEVATNFEAIVATATVLLGLSGLILLSFKEEIKEAFTKKGAARDKAVKKVLLDTRKKMMNA